MLYVKTVLLYTAEYTEFCFECSICLFGITEHDERKTLFRLIFKHHARFWTFWFLSQNTHKDFNFNLIFLSSIFQLIV